MASKRQQEEIAIRHDVTLDNQDDLEPDRKVGVLADEAERAGRLDLAARILEQGVKSFPSSGGLWNQLGLTYSSVERWDEAVSSFDKARRLGATNWMGLALALEGTGDVDGAERAYRSGLGEEPSNADIMVNLGVLLEQNGRAKEAELVLRGAVTIDPKVNWVLADVLIALNDTRGALRAVDEAILAGERRAHLDRALLVVEMGEDPTADFQAAIDAGAPFARREFALYLNSIGSSALALDLARDAIADGDELSYLPAGLAADALGFYEDAVRYLRRAVEGGDEEYEEELQIALGKLARE